MILIIEISPIFLSIYFLNDIFRIILFIFFFLYYILRKISEKFISDFLVMIVLIFQYLSFALSDIIRIYETQNLVNLEITFLMVLNIQEK